jgi:prepilin-type N-terminal cleavage/methylation domain-containing protein
MGANELRTMNKTQDSGFTLLEMIVVVLVLVLAISVTYPSLMRGSSSLGLRACGRDVLNTFRLAKEQAITEQTSMIVTVDREHETLTLSNSLGDGLRTYTMPSNVQIYRMALAGNEVSDNAMSVRFLANGSADEAEVDLKADSGLQIIVITDPMTGGGRIVQPGDNSR